MLRQQLRKASPYVSVANTKIRAGIRAQTIKLPYLNSPATSAEIPTLHGRSKLRRGLDSIEDPFVEKSGKSVLHLGAIPGAIGLVGLVTATTPEPGEDLNWKLPSWLKKEKELKIWDLPAEVQVSILENMVANKTERAYLPRHRPLQTWKTMRPGEGGYPHWLIALEEQRDFLLLRWVPWPTFEGVRALFAGKEKEKEKETDVKQEIPAERGYLEKLTQLLLERGTSA
jgi:hypothetical protein